LLNQKSKNRPSLTKTKNKKVKKEKRREKTKTWETRKEELLRRQANGGTKRLPERGAGTVVKEETTGKKRKNDQLAGPPYGDEGGKQFLRKGGGGLKEKAALRSGNRVGGDHGRSPGGGTRGQKGAGQNSREKAVVTQRGGRTGWEGRARKRERGELRQNLVMGVEQRTKTNHTGSIKGMSIHQKTRARGRVKGE